MFQVGIHCRLCTTKLERLFTESSKELGLTALQLTHISENYNVIDVGNISQFPCEFNDEHVSHLSNMIIFWRCSTLEDGRYPRPWAPEVEILVNISCFVMFLILRSLYWRTRPISGPTLNATDDLLKIYWIADRFGIRKTSYFSFQDVWIASFSCCDLFRWKSLQMCLSYTSKAECSH